MTSLLKSTRKALSSLTSRFRSAGRVPVILQMSAVECGAACLAMILTYHGRRTSASECRECCGAGRDGATALAIAESARRFGLRVKGYSVGLADFRQVSLPAVVHWNFDHFLVVERWSPSAIDVVDPAVGRTRLTAEEFDAGFTGVVLTFEPGAHFERRRTRPHLTRRAYLSYALRSPGAAGMLGQVIGASLLLQLLGLALPVFTKVLIDYVIPFRATDVMLLLGLGTGIWVLTNLVGTYLRSSVLIYLQARLDSQMVIDFFEHVLALPFKFFQQRTSGDLLMRLGSNATLREIFTSQTVSAVLDGGLVVVYLGILVAWQPWFGLLVVGLGMLQVALLLAVTPAMHRLLQRDLRAQADSQSYLVEALNGISTLKASGAEYRALERWSDLFFNQLNVSLKRSRLSATMETLMSSLRLLSPLVLLWAGAHYVIAGRMTIGAMLALNALAASFLSPLASLVSNGQRLQLAGAHLERIGDVLEAAPEQATQAGAMPTRLSGSLEIRKVSFKYDSAAPFVLRDISLRVEPGQKIALVGRTGSGKSTLARLILGLYQPTEGEILYDGRVRLEELNLRWLRQQFGVVPQEPFLFSGSIRENISFQDPSLSLEQIERAAKLAAIHDEITKMPMGYETIIAEGGTAISGGQRQRLALARALVHQPTFLLLDEATSHLDAVTEDLIDESLNQMRCTRIIIAHRLSTIRNADLILVMDGGRIVEKGLHEDLLAIEGRYADLVRGQIGYEGLQRRMTQPVSSIS